MTILASTRTPQILVLLLMFMLAACATDSPRRGMSDAGIDSAGAPQNEALATAATYAISTSGQPSVTEVSPEGISQVSTGPHGAAGLGPYGVSVSSPNDVQADEIVAEFFEPHSADGAITVLPKLIRVTGFSSSASPVIEATTDQVALFAEYGATLSADNRDRYLRLLDTVDAALAEAVRAALGLATGGVSEAAGALGGE